MDDVNFFFFSLFLALLFIPFFFACFDCHASCQQQRERKKKHIPHLFVQHK